MLNTLRIQNMALIPSVEINFGSAFNVLTGETGAGKSIIIGSLNFIFGDKLPVTTIRSGADFAKVTAVFDDVIISRTLKADGKSDIRINDEPVTLKALKEASASFIDIHGQHDTEKLLLAKNHIQILDSFGKVDLAKYKEEYDKLQSLKKSLSSFGDNDAERERLIDLYKYQIDEIQNAELTQEEEDELQSKLSVMRNSAKITEAVSQAISHLEAADSEIAQCLKRTGSVSQYDDKISQLNERLNSGSMEITDGLISLKEYLDNAEYNQTSLEEIDERLELIKNIKRKYGKTIADVLVFLEKTTKEYDRLISADEEIARLKSEIENQSGEVQKAAGELTQCRKVVAETLQKELVAHLIDLGMPDSKFEVKFQDAMPKSDGADNIEFYFSANLGEGVRPLAQIISGGEMSRLMLAIKTLANMDKDKTLVFDEIDTGISGLMGVAVAGKLSLLSKNCQIIVVTHLASIAAEADTHFLIQKNVAENKTVTCVSPLNKEDRVKEISRIIGGGDTATAHAESLLNKKR